MKRSASYAHRFAQSLAALTFFFLTSLFLTGISFAADGQVVVGDAQGAVGDLVTVDVTLKDHPGVAAFEFHISYDADLLELTNASERTVSGVQFSTSYADMPFKCMWSNPTQENMQGDAVLCALTFRIKSSASNKATVSIDYDAGDVYRTEQPTSIDVNPAKVNGSIRIDQPSSGEVSVGNGEAALGESVTVDVALKDHPGVAAFEFHISYDADKLKLIDAKEKDISGVQFSSNYADRPFTCMWSSAAQENFTGDAVLCQLTFEIQSDAFETTKVTIDYDAGDVYRTEQRQSIDVNPEKISGTIRRVDLPPVEQGRVVVGDADVVSGQSVTVPLKLEKHPGVAAFEFHISYDTSKLELTGAKEKDISGAQFSSSYSASPFKVMWSSSTQANYTGDAVLCELTFLAKSGASGKASVFVDYDTGDVYRTDKQKSVNVNPDKVNGSINITEPKTFHVTLAPVSHGSASVSPTKATQGEQITITDLTPDNGYAFEKITYTPEGKSAIEITGASFNMPAANVTVNVIFKEKPPEVYNITVATATNGKASASAATAKKGETITVSVNPNNGYMLDKATYTPNGGSATDITSKLSFDMPDADVTVNVTFKEKPPEVYNVTVGSVSHGTASVSPTSGTEGATITVTPNPDNGYDVEKITYTPEGKSAIDITSKKSFDMPAADVTVNVTFKEKPPEVYNVTVNAGTGGKASADKSKAAKGDTVNVTATPDNNGYEVEKITFTPKGGSETDITSKKSFIMPDADVTVNVTFRQYVHPVTLSPTYNGKASVDKSTAKKDETVTVTATPDKGYELEKITYTPKGGSETDITSAKSFKMPDADVIVSVTFKKSLYKVTVKTDGHGEASVTKTEGWGIDDAVIVTVTPGKGYEPDKITWTPEGGSATDMTEKKLFNMPAANVTVNVTFRPTTYTVTVSSADNGAVSVPKTEGWKMGDTVAVEVKPKDGYQATKITYTPKGGSATDITGKTSFTMPDADVTITPVFGFNDYSVTVTTGSNGSASVSKKDGWHIKDKVNVTATPSNGYEVEKITWTPAGGSATDITDPKSFDMPAANVTVNVTFRKIPDITYTVTLASVSHGTASVSRTKGVEGDQVSVTSKPDEGYTLDKITYTPAGGSASDITSAKSFKMPAKNVTVNVTFKTAPTYTVTFNANGGSVSTATAKTASTGKLSSLPTATRSGYTFDGWYTSTGGGTRINNSYTFAKDTTVYAHWSKVPTYAISLSSMSGGSVTPNSSSAASGEKVTLTVSPQGGYELTSLEVKTSGGSAVKTSANGNAYTFTMPAEKVTVSASFTRNVQPSRFITWSAQNGRFENNVSSAVAETKITVNAVPNSGYSLQKITWKPEGGSETDITVSKFFIMPDKNVTVSAVFQKDPVISEEEEEPFDDVKKGMYCFDAVKWAQSKGVTSGKTARLFAPNDACTRGQVVTFLWRAAGQPSPSSMSNPFTDVSSGSYYYRAILWAREQGITTGITPTSFEPNSTVTRAQAVTFLHRFAKPSSSGASNPFNDVPRSKYYYNAVLWANETKVTTGTTSTTFTPDRACTRGNIVTFLYRHMGPPET